MIDNALYLVHLVFFVDLLLDDLLGFIFNNLNILVLVFLLRAHPFFENLSLNLLFSKQELLAVVVFLLNEAHSSFSGSLSDVFSGLWEEFTKLKELLLAHTHELDVGDGVNS